MRAHYLLGAALVLGAVPAGCLVSSFEKVDDVGASGSGGSGMGGTGGSGTGGVAGSASGGVAGVGGGTGGSSSCGTCADGPKGDPGCCFNTPAGANECGAAVADYGGVCLPLGGQGASVQECPTHDVAGSELTGCCMPGGLCGLQDGATHGLGCMPSEAFSGVTVTACGADACGAYCMAAANSQCGLAANHPFAAYACTQRCQTLGCSAEVTALTGSNCAVTTECTAATDGHPYFGNCAPQNLAMAKCLKKIECGRYCRMVADKCAASPQYGAGDQCEKFCESWVKGDFNVASPSIQNSIYCRMDFVATQDCAAAGPAGHGTGSGALCDQGSRQTYCDLYKLRCPNEHAQDWPTPCISGAGSIAATNTFKYGSNTGNTIECRIEALLDGDCANARKTAGPKCQ